MYRDELVDEIREDLCKRFKNQPNSMAASDDEVRIAYLLGKLDEVHKNLTEANQEIESLKGEIENMNEEG